MLSPEQAWADGESFPWPSLGPEAVPLWPGGILSIIRFGFPSPPGPTGSCLRLVYWQLAAELLGILSPLGPGGLGFGRSRGIPGRWTGFSQQWVLLPPGLSVGERRRLCFNWQ